jgi:oligoribonuclease NrnB/cAMP/cGMP phosphodiesterase (DHH superfamily)
MKKNKENQMKISCIYHGNCADGFTSAWIVNKYFKNKTNDIKFIPGKYGEEPPYEKLKGRELYIVDFSYPVDVMKKLNEVCTKITVYDHHKTAEPIMEQLDFVEKVFDMDKSGALITWEQLFPDKEVPELVEYVSDRDLWKFELFKSKEFSMFLFSYEYTFENWDKIDREWRKKFYEYIEQGEAIQRKHLKDVKELCQATFEMKRFTKFGDTVYPVSNIPYTMASEGCKYLADKLMDEYQPQVGITYYRNSDGKYVFSMRSNDDTDVAEMAKKYGGGGHKNASGFVVDQLPFV